ncbi:hypothetical protein MTR_7g056383 [Medicago truncatula]|uniref:Uncharacterized protein n=1 Tax=Medicago truncatula TaxID=3880 RepID=A0A072TYZ9_MEDTR|nr:hypothetical protein MTR_7g056383 [Medicago truncatula]
MPLSHQHMIKYMTVHKSKLFTKDPVPAICTGTYPCTLAMASLLDKMESDWVKMVDSRSNSKRCKNSQTMSKKDNPTIDY